MKKQLLLLFTIIPLIGFSQNDTEKDQVIKVIQQLFDGMRANDSSMIRSAFTEEAQLKTVIMDRDGKTLLHETELKTFILQLSTPLEKKLDEKIWDYQVDIDGLLASVWTEYSFYLGGDIHHCGVNAFHLIKKQEGWKILQIIDTRRKQNCREEPIDHESSINKLVDNWHLAAAKADADAFFGAMTREGIYIGTDANERWLRDELRNWSKKAFSRDSAWDFKPSEREIYLSEDQKTAWWEESLDTWMGPCRGSGVARLTSNGWKIAHYHLSVTVPNEKIESFIDLIKK